VARKRRVDAFGLSFLDCMCCGFGAVILFFMIINTGHDEIAKSLEGEAQTLQEEVEARRARLSALEEEAAASLEQDRGEQGDSEALRQQLEREIDEMADLQAKTLARKDHINSLKTDLRSLDAERKRLQAGAKEPRKQGKAIRKVVGQADRQYVTGLRVGGRRILVLVDASASMLGNSILDIVRRRHRSDADKRDAPKWKRAVATVDWLTAQFPPGSLFQIYTFNTAASPVVSGSENRWLESTPDELDDAVRALRKVVPEGGTSLHNAFAVIDDLIPAADELFLVTDGLPTQAAGAPFFKTVSPDRRMSHFRDSLDLIPQGLPVNIVLFPMEGDPAAPHAFWQLAWRTRGSFMSPSKDWP